MHFWTKSVYRIFYAPNATNLHDSETGLVNKLGCSYLNELPVALFMVRTMCCQLSLFSAARTDQLPQEAISCHSTKVSSNEIGFLPLVTNQAFSLNNLESQNQNKIN